MTGKGLVLAGFALAAIAGGIGLYVGANSPQPAAASSYQAPQQPPIHATLAPALPPPPSHRYAMRQGRAFGYRASMSANDLGAGLATKALTMVEFNGMIGRDYSFQTINPATGNLIVMRCSEPCEFMNVMNYDHRVPEVFPVTPESIMAAVVADARAGYLNASQ